MKKGTWGRRKLTEKACRSAAFAGGRSELKSTGKWSEFRRLSSALFDFHLTVI
jgi:hypothetical protein